MLFTGSFSFTCTKPKIWQNTLGGYSVTVCKEQVFIKFPVIALVNLNINLFPGIKEKFMTERLCHLLQPLPSRVEWQQSPFYAQHSEAAFSFAWYLNNHLLPCCLERKWTAFSNIKEAISSLQHKRTSCHSFSLRCEVFSWRKK